MQAVHDLTVGKNRRDRIESSGQCLSDQGQVGLDMVVLLGQEFPRTSQAGLDFIQDQHHIVFFTNTLGLFEIPVIRDDDPGLSLNGLYQKPDGVGRNGFF